MQLYIVLNLLNLYSNLKKTQFYSKIKLIIEYIHIHTVSLCMFVTVYVSVHTHTLLEGSFCSEVYM